MFASLRLATQRVPNELLSQMFKNVSSQFSTTAPLPHDNSVYSSTSMAFDDEQPMRIVNVDMDTMMDAPEPLMITDVNGVPLAPVDVDPWVCEEDAKHGTVDIEAYEREQKVTLPPIPKNRCGEFQFKGIKVVLPKRMLRPETYRYRLDADDVRKPDDIRVCAYEK